MISSNPFQNNNNNNIHTYVQQASFCISRGFETGDLNLNIFMKSEHLNVICGEQKKDMSERDEYEVLTGRWPSLDVTSVCHCVSMTAYSLCVVTYFDCLLFNQKNIQK